MYRPILLLLALFLAPGLAHGQGRPEAPLTSLHRIAPQTPPELQNLFRPTGAPLPFVSAHRGGAQSGFPENAIATFENTLKHAYAILEVDPRTTRDGALVLMHDPTLDRTTTGTGLLADRTLAELRTLRLKDPDGHETPYSIPTLDEALEWARGKTVLVLDAKDVPLADRVKAIERHHAESYAMLILSRPADIKACHDLNPNIMMEVFITNRAQLDAFDRLGVPWRNVVAFVGHTPPEDPTLCAAIHARGAATMAGTSRNLDRRFLDGRVSSPRDLEPPYRALLESGVDVIETDIPTTIGPLLHREASVPVSLPLRPPTRS